MFKYLASCFLIIFLFSPVYAQETSNKVEGLELPADQTVNFDEGFVNIQAKTEGTLKWLVISNTKIKYVSVDSTKTIIISVPPSGGQISVFAIAVINGKPTEFARTNVTISGNGPTPKPTPTPNPTGSEPVHVTFLVDLNSSTPEIAALLNSKTLRQWITENNLYFRYYDYASAAIKQLKFDSVINKVGGNAIMVIQDKNGVVLQAIKMPATEEEIKNSINSLRK